MWWAAPTNDGEDVEAEAGEVDDKGGDEDSPPPTVECPHAAADAEGNPQQNGDGEEQRGEAEAAAQCFIGPPSTV